MVRLLEAQLEGIERSYEALLRARLRAYLDAVQTKYAALEPLTLEDPKEYHQGNIPNGLLSRYVQATPAILLEAIQIEPEADNYRGFVNALLIHVITRGGTPRQAHLLCQRHALAVASLCADERPTDANITGVAKVGYTVDLTVLDPMGAFLKQSEIRVPLHVGVVLSTHA